MPNRGLEPSSLKTPTIERKGISMRTSEEDLLVLLLTNDDLDKIEGSRTELVGKIQQKYGKSKDEAEREVNDFEKGH